MKKPDPRIEDARVKKGHMATTSKNGMNGVFQFRGPRGLDILCIVSDGGGWDHVSFEEVPPNEHVKQDVPTWEETCAVKDYFFESYEVAIQIHPAKKNYVNLHPFVLHLWRPQNQEIPLPPLWMV
jgi:hypothetical protein